MIVLCFERLEDVMVGTIRLFYDRAVKTTDPNAAGLEKIGVSTHQSVVKSGRFMIFGDTGAKIMAVILNFVNAIINTDYKMTGVKIGEKIFFVIKSKSENNFRETEKMRVASANMGKDADLSSILPVVIACKGYKETKQLLISKIAAWLK